MTLDELFVLEDMLEKFKKEYNYMEQPLYVDKILNFIDLLLEENDHD